MATVDLTDAYIRALSVDKSTEISDLREKGLSIRAQPTGTITFAFRMRSPGGETQRAVIGYYPDMRLSEARRRASALRAKIRDGGDITAAAKKAAVAVKAELSKGIPTLAEVLKEYEEQMSARRKTWRPTKNGKTCEAVRRIDAVFSNLLDVPVTKISLTDLAYALTHYAPKSGKVKANGQVSKARAYLMPVFDWCAHQNRFKKVGIGRSLKLDVVDLRETYDPASDDYDIKGRRDRALDHLELGSVLPLLVWPAPECLGMKLNPGNDLRPVALKFLLLTCARLDELVTMRWGDFRENSGLWHKPYVKTISGPPRQQNLPLSDAAITLLKQLPNFNTRQTDQLVFPNAVGNGMGNWNRITNAVQRESKTLDWHRHDLRRTGASIMKALGVSPRVVDEILAHNAKNEDEGTSKALESYFSSTHLLEHIEDPKKVALDKLAEALNFIENEGQNR
jgi:integrase